MKRLYVSDLDGTLLDADSRLSIGSRRLLNQAIGHGALFTIATARTPATVSRLLQGLDMRLDTIVMTGAARWNAATGIYSHIKHFPTQMARHIMAQMRHSRFPSFIYTLTDNMIHIYRLGAMTDSERTFIQWREHTPYKRVEFDTRQGGDVWSGPEPDPSKVVLFYSLQPHTAVEAFHPALAQAVPRANILHYRDPALADTSLSTLEIFAPGATKAAAVQEMAAELGADSTTVFGDNVNDMSMMQAADCSIAPANAIEQVRRAATSIIGSNTSDSVARYIHAETTTSL